MGVKSCGIAKMDAVWTVRTMGLQYTAVTASSARRSASFFAWCTPSAESCG
jgi:hypothetical protein